MEADFITAVRAADVIPAPKPDYALLKSLLAGGVAGIVVDIALFPIDTVKTRLQSEFGFWGAGGFRAIYKGLAPTAAGSAPTAALFFFAYESFKKYLGGNTNAVNSPFVHMVSASGAEVLACMIRVPVEIAKQRRQTLLGSKQQTALQILWHAYKTEGIRRGLYRGFSATVMREIPFSLIQFPLWEYFKSEWSPMTGQKSSPINVALCGAVAGGISAGLTTPLDVLKTRIMLAGPTSSSGSRKPDVRQIVNSIYHDRGIMGFFSGFTPRILWITLGGAFFFGFYDLTLRLLGANGEKDVPN